MDPKACFEALLNAQINNDAYEINQYKSDLINWLTNGGFAPEVQLLERGSHKTVNLIALTWAGDATIRFRNGRKRVVSLRSLATVD